jgi:pimeloyl-ACP methyl ester carboxylesterase
VAAIGKLSGILLNFKPIIVKKNCTLLIIYLSLFPWLISCGNAQKNVAQAALTVAPAAMNQSKITTPKTKVYPMLDSIATLTIGGHKLDVRSPKGDIKGNIIVLPGWNFPKEDWCNKSSLCKKALGQGFRLILPEMSKSVYSAQFYPQTLVAWKKYPDLNWVTKQMIPHLQKEYGILLATQKNFLLGLSTGGRGVVAIGVAVPDLFVAGAALSGDYDPTKMTTDRLMIGYLGNYAQFPARWKTGEENLVYHAKRLKMGLYIGHGRQDKVVPFQQSLLLYNALKKVSPDLKVKTNWTNAGHNYKYWNSEVAHMLTFFEEFL